MERQTLGTWSSRALIWFFTILLTLLFYWLLGFVLADIGSVSGPSFQEIESSRLSPDQVAEAIALDRKLTEARRRIATEKGRQLTLRDSTDSSQKTLNQLLELQKLNLQQGTSPNDKERAALVESEQLFLDNQREYQRLNQQIAQLEEEVRNLEDAKQRVELILGAERIPVQQEFAKQMERHNLWIAFWKLSVLLPLLLISFGLYWKFRSGPYWALIYALGISVIVKVGIVMHEYFPARYFKYVLIGTLLLVTLRILVYLLRSVAFPKREWILKQNREAYESFLCPICDHPIRRGPLKYMAWTKRTIRKTSIPCDAKTPEEPYTCPSCSTTLFATCIKCGAVRHSLLPACTHCGSQLDLHPQ